MLCEQLHGIWGCNCLHSHTLQVLFFIHSKLPKSRGFVCAWLCCSSRGVLVAWAPWTTPIWSQTTAPDRSGHCTGAYEISQNLKHPSQSYKRLFTAWPFLAHFICELLQPILDHDKSAVPVSTSCGCYVLLASLVPRVTIILSPSDILWRATLYAPSVPQCKARASCTCTRMRPAATQSLGVS